VFALTNIFDQQVMSLFKSQTNDVLIQEYQNNISNALFSCDESFEMLEKSALIAILFSIEVLLMVFTFIRLSHKTSKFSSSSPIMLGFGAILLSTYYLIIGLLLPGYGQINSLLADYQIIKILGAGLIVFANIIFVFQVFIQIVLEKVED
jgi:formate-dependent nitrite reductase membrane component NrfD